MEPMRATGHLSFTLSPLKARANSKNILCDNLRPNMLSYSTICYTLYRNQLAAFDIGDTTRVLVVMFGATAQPSFEAWRWQQEAPPDPEEELHQRRIQAYLRGEILDPSEFEGKKDDGEGEVPVPVVEKLFSDEELQEWTGEQAVLWISEAQNAFEILGFPVASEPHAASLRLRYRRLSLLVHPDKNPHGDASACFQRLSEALRVLFDDAGRQELLNQLFEDTMNPGPQSGMTGMPEPPEPDQPAAEVSEEGLNDSVHERVMQHSKLQQLLRQKRGKRSRSPVRGPRAGHRETLAEEWQRMAAAAAPVAPAAPAAPGAPAAPAAPAEAGAASGANVERPVTQDVPESLWQKGGDSALKLAGWRRLESRRMPGQFYFAHLATGHTVMEGARSRIQAPSWEMRQSRHDPSVHYYVNSVTGETRMGTSQLEKN